MRFPKSGLFLIIVGLIGTAVHAHAACSNYEDHFPGQCAAVKEDIWSHPSDCQNYVECLCCAEYERRFPDQEKSHWRQEDWIEACKMGHFCVECGDLSWRTYCSQEHWDGPYDTAQAISAFEFDPIPEFGTFNWCSRAIWDQCTEEYKSQYGPNAFHYPTIKKCADDKNRICATCPVDANRHFGNWAENEQFCPGNGFGYFPPVDEETFLSAGNVTATATHAITGGTLLGGIPIPEDQSLSTRAATAVLPFAIATFSQCFRWAPCRDSVIKVGGLALGVVAGTVIAVIDNNDEDVDPEAVPPKTGLADVGAPMPEPEDPDGDGPEINVEHIFRGEINNEGKAVGFHHRGSTSTYHQGYARIVEITKPRNSQGVYEARIEVYNPNTGQWIPKQTPSTFFPESWSAEQVLVEIRGAFANRTMTGIYRWESISPSGIKFTGYIDVNIPNKISAVWPVYL